MLNKEVLQDDYSSLILSIKGCIEKKNFEKALDLVQLASRIAYQYNFLPDLTDLDLEDFITTVAKNTLEPVLITDNNEKILFYDYFGYDNRGLTQQYLRALFELGKEVVYVLENANQYYSSSDIFNEIRAYSKASIYTLSGTGHVSKARQIIEIIKNEKPAKAFLHLAPWDVDACLAFYQIKGVTRYQINLTDHAFWLGVNITDYNLEFRSFGFNLSHQKRKLKKSQLRILPYYPIISQQPFEGFPVGTKGKKLIFSGGSIYKILGEDLIFLHLVKELLEIHPDLVFVFAGSGNTAPVIKFIADHGLEERFFLIGDRKDIFAVLQKVDYCVTTFPYTGGLMNQVAAAAKTPIFFFSTPEYQCNDLSEMFFKLPDLETFTIKEDLVARFKEVFNNKALLDTYGENLQASMITPQEFLNGLKKILIGENPFQYLEKDYNVDMHQKVSFSYLLESENLYNPQYKNIVLSSLTTAYERKKFMPGFYLREQSFNWETDKIRYFKNYYRTIFPK